MIAIRIDCPENLNPNSAKVLIRPDPETLYPMILAGDLDYAFGYMGSVIGEGPAGIRTVNLPAQMNLSDLSLVSSTYNRVSINFFSDKPDRKIAIKLGAKANGLDDSAECPEQRGGGELSEDLSWADWTECAEGRAYHAY